MSIHPLKNKTVDTQAFISNVKQAMQKQNIREAELSRLTGIPLTTLHKILSGKTSDPRISTLQILANYFGVTVDELFTGIQDKSSRIQSIPIISWNDCSKGENYIHSLNLTNWKEWINIEYISDNAYSLVSKPSMEPQFTKGTHLVVVPNIKPKDGDLVIVAYKDVQSATLRELLDDGPNKYLLPCIPNEPKERMSDDTTIIGVVVESKFYWHDKLNL